MRKKIDDKHYICWYVYKVFSGETKQVWRSLDIQCTLAICSRTFLNVTLFYFSLNNQILSIQLMCNERTDRQTGTSCYSDASTHCKKLCDLYKATNKQKNRQTNEFLRRHSKIQALIDWATSKNERTETGKLVPRTRQMFHVEIFAVLFFVRECFSFAPENRKSRVVGS